MSQASEPPKAKQPSSIDRKSQKAMESIENLEELQHESIDAMCLIHGEIADLVYHEAYWLGNSDFEQLEELSKIYESLASAYNSIFGGKK